MDSFRNILCYICKNSIVNTSSTFATPCGHVVSHQHCLIQQLQNSPSCLVCKRDCNLDKMIGLNLIFGDEISINSSYKILIKKLIDKNNALSTVLMKMSDGTVNEQNINVPELLHFSDLDDFPSSLSSKIKNLKTSAENKENEDFNDTASTAGGIKPVNFRDFPGSFKSSSADVALNDHQSTNCMRKKDSVYNDMDYHSASNGTSSSITAFSNLDLVTHLKRTTGTKPTFTCNFCAKSFGFKSHFIAHLRIHTGDKPYVCSTCQKRFSQKAALAIHMRTHTGEKPYSCQICSKGFSQKAGLIVHMRKKHTKESHTVIAHNKIYSREKLYSCNVGYEVFSANQNLSTDEIMKTEEKPYSCDVCDETFSLQQNLIAHNKVHTGENP